MYFFLPAGAERPGFAMMSLRHGGAGFQFANEGVVGSGLLPSQVDVETQQWHEADDGDVVGRGSDIPELPPIHKYSSTSAAKAAHKTCTNRSAKALRHPKATARHFRASFTSEASITGAGPEMPPSLRTRQKCTTMKIDATMGMPMQCQI